MITIPRSRPYYRKNDQRETFPLPPGPVQELEVIDQGSSLAAPVVVSVDELCCVDVARASSAATAKRQAEAPD